ncbi:Uncharacterised protein [Escherichia coli]|nr:Uncharacterised protein [Escherichia coli]
MIDSAGSGNVVNYDPGELELERYVRQHSAGTGRELCQFRQTA